METLKNLEIGKSAVISKVGGTGALRQHFLDMGMIPGVKVTMMKHAPMGDPLEIRVFNYELTLRKEEAAQIEIEYKEKPSDSDADFSYSTAEKETSTASNDLLTSHPGLGEDGKYHEKETETPLPAGTILTYGLSETRTAEKQRFLTSLQAQTSMLEIFRALQ